MPLRQVRQLGRARAHGLIVAQQLLTETTTGAGEHVALRPLLVYDHGEQHYLQRYPAYHVH